MRMLAVVVVLSGCVHVRQATEIARDAYIVGGLVMKLAEPDADANEARKEVSAEATDATETCDECPFDTTCFYIHHMCPATTTGSRQSQ